MYGSGVKKINVVLSPLSGDASFVRWLTAAGSLGDFNLGGPVDLTLTAKSSDASGLFYALAEGSLPAGLSLDASSGQIAGLAPDSVAVDTFTLRATNGSGQFSDQMLSLNFVNRAPVWQTPAGSIGAAKGGNDFDASLLATDPQSWPVSYSVTAGALPAGLVLSANTGRLAGTLPILPETTVFDFTVTASDGAYSTARAFSLTVNFVATLAWASASGSLGSEVQGRFFYARVSALSYAPNAVVSYAVTAGSLPAGLALNGTLGSVSGTLPAVSVDTLIPFTVTASDGIASLPSQFSLTVTVDNNTVDPFANAVVLLLHMNQTDNANAAVQQVFVDQMQHMVTGSGAIPPVNTRDTHLFGNAAGQFRDGALTITGPHGAEVSAFDLSLTDFTLECAILPASGTSVALLSLGDGLSGRTLALSYDGAGHLAVDYQSTAGTPRTAVFPWTMPYGVWSRLALVRSSTTLLAFVDGVLLGSQSVSSGLAAAEPLQVCLGTIRAGAPAQATYQGLLDEVRLTRAARYSENYALATRPWPNVPVWSLPASLPDAVEMTAYSSSVLATQADNHALLYAAADLPEGLTINPVLGVIAGLAPAAASDTSYQPQFTVTDGFNSVTRSLALIDRHHVPPSWLTAGGALAACVEGGVVHRALAASSPQFLPLTYLILAGQLPPGLALDGAAINGTAPAESTDANFSFTLGVTDGIATVARDFSLLVTHNLPPVWVSGFALLTAVQGQTVSLALQATDPLGQTLGFAVVSGTLPLGVTLNASGLLTGTLPTVSSDTTVNFSVQVRNAGGLTATRAFAITVLAGVLPSWLTLAGSLGNYLAASDSVHVVLAGNANIVDVIPTFTVVTGTLPAGLTLASQGGIGLISGIPASVGVITTQDFVIALDNGSDVALQNFWITVTPNRAIIWTSASNLGSHPAGSAIADTLNAISLDGAGVSYTVGSGTLPGGLSLDSSGLLSGSLTPVSAASSPQTSNFSIVADNASTTASRSFALAVTSALPVWTTPALTAGAAKLGTIYTTIGYSTTFVATSTAPLTYSVTGGTLPSGLALDGVTGILSGTPNSVAAAGFSITASDGINSVTAAFTAIIAIPGTPVWITQPTGVTSATASVPYSYQLVATDPNHASLTFAVTAGTLPAGLSLTTSGQFTGTPAPVAATTSTTLTLSVTNGMESADSTIVLGVLLNDQLSWQTPAGLLLTAPATTSVHVPLLVNNASIHPATFAILSGTFPNTLTLDANSGVITGNLPAVGATDHSYGFTVTATNTVNTSNQAFSIVAQAVTPVWQTAGGSLGSDYSARLFSQTIAASSPLGLSDISFVLLTGALPGGLTLTNNGDNSATIAGYLPDVTATQTANFVIAAQNATVSVSRAFSISTLYSNLQWSIPAGSLGTLFGDGAYSQTGIRTTLPARFTLTGGTLPNGVILAPSTGNLSGVVNAVTTPITSVFEITATALTADATAISRVFSLTVAPAAAPQVADPLSDFVVLELHLNTDITDVMRHTPVNLYNGSGPFSTTTRSVFNGSSEQFTGIAVGIADAPEFDFSTTDFTVEFYAAFASLPRASLTSTFFANPYVNLAYGNGALLVTVLPVGSGNPTVLSFACPIDLAWHHIALVNSGGSLTVLLDGIALGSAVTVGALALVSSNPKTFVAGLSTGPFTTVLPFVGFMAELRVTRAARYSGNFTLPGLSWPDLPAIAPLASLTALYGGIPATAQQITASDPYVRGVTFSLASGTLPNGLTLSGSGRLSGTPDNPVTDTSFPLGIAVSDGLNSTHINTSLLVRYYAPAAWTTAPGSLGSVLSGYAFTANLLATSAQGRTITYSLLSGTLPSGLSLNAGTGKITGTTSVLASDATKTFTIGANDTLSITPLALSITVQANNPPVWSTAAGSLGSVTGGSTFSATVVAIDPEGQSVVYSIATGSLPSGLTLNGSSGTITGTAANRSSNSTFNFILRASNGFASATLAVSIALVAVLAPVFQTASATVLQIPGNVAFSYQVRATDPAGLALTFSQTGLPPNMAIAADGLISGTPPLPTHFDFGNVSPQVLTYVTTLTVTNGLASAVLFPFSFRVFVPQLPVFTSPAAGSLGTYLAGTALPAKQFVATNPLPGLTNTYSIDTGALPASLVLANTGSLSGNLGAIASNATYAFSVAAFNGYISASRAYNLTVQAFALPTWTTAAGTLGTITALAAFSKTLVAVSHSGQAPSYTLTSGTLPNGLSLDAGTGLISGTLVNPASSATISFSVSMSDGFTSLARAFSITANIVPAPALGIQNGQTSVTLLGGPNGGSSFHFPINSTYNGGSVLPGTLNVAFGYDANGLTLSYSTPDTLPSGITLLSNGTLTGTLPDDAGIGPTAFAVTVSNGYTNSVTRTFTLYAHYVTAPNWTTASGLLLTLKGGLAITAKSLVATDPQSLALTYSVTSGTLPTGLSLSSSGLLTGTAANPATDFEADFTVTAANIQRGTPQDFAIIVHANTPPVWNTAPGSLGTVASKTLITPIALSVSSALGDALTYSFIAGTFPTNLILNTATGVITGTTITAQTDTTYNFTLRVNETDGVNSPVSQVFSFTVLAYEPPTWSGASGSLGSVLGGYAFSYTLAASDPHGLALTYSRSAGTLPPGLTLSSHGVISGTATNPASADTTYNFNVAASDGQAAPASSSFSILVSYNTPPVWSTSAGTLGSFTGFDAVDVFVSATDPNSQTLTYSVSAGTLPNGLTINGSSGEITGTLANPASTATVTFTLKATNGTSFSTRVFSFAISKYLAPSWSGVSSALGTYVNGAVLSLPLAASDPQGGGLSFSLASGAVPPSLSIDGTTGQITGTLDIVAVLTSSSFTVTATNAHFSTNQSFTLVTKPYLAPVWNTPAGLLGSVFGGSPFSQTLSASDPNGLSLSYQFWDGALPAGLSIASNGLLNGTAQNTSTTTSTFVIAATNGTIMTTRSFSITVNATAPPVWSTAANLGAANGTSTVAFPLTATDPRGLSITYLADPANATNGFTLPAGLLFNAANATIYGTLTNPNTTTSFSFAVDATNGIASAARTFTGTVVHVGAPVWQTANGTLGSVVGLSTCASVPLEMNFEGNAIVDNAGHSIDAGSATLSNSTASVGRSSLALTGTRVIIPPTGNEFALRNLDFTIELSVRFNSFNDISSQNWQSVLIEQWGLNNLGWGLSYYTSNGLNPGLQFYYSTDGTTSQFAGAAWTPSLNTWYRLAVCRNGSTLRCFVNGSQIGSSITGFTPVIFASTVPVIIGYAATLNGGRLDGFLDELRLTTGLGRYTAPYTPPLLPFTSAPGITQPLAIDASGLPVSYTLSGTLPPGLSLNAGTGLLSGSFGNVTNATSYPFSLIATNGFIPASASFAITVKPETAPTWSTSAGSIGSVLGGYALTTAVAATDGNYPGLFYALANATSLPTGFTLNAQTGSITGTSSNPAASDATTNFSVSVTDGYLSNTLAVSLTVLYNAPPVIALTTGQLVGPWFGGVGMTTTITATDAHSQPITFTASLPAGLTISNSGVISGTIAQPATVFANVAASVTASNGFTNNTIAFFIEEEQTPPPNWVSPAAGLLGNVVENIAISPNTLLAVDPSGANVAYSITLGSLPIGLSLNAVSGVIAGIPNESGTAGTYAFTVAAANLYVSNTRVFSYIIRNNAPPVFGTSVLPTGFSTENYVGNIVASDPTGLGQTITYALASGALPGGLTLASNGAVTGVVTTVSNTATSNFTVQASTAGGNTISSTLGIQTTPYLGPTWTTSAGSLGTMIGGHSFTNTVGAVDHESLGLSYAVSSGSLPAGLTLSNATISGIATNPAGSNTVSNFDITASDLYGSNTQSFSLQVLYNSAPSFSNQGALLQLYGGNTIVANVAVLAVDTNNQTLTYALANSTTLPANLLLNSATGRLTGTAVNPGANTISSFIVSANNGFYTGFGAFSIEVDQTLPPVYTTAAGSLGTYASNTAVATAVVATDPQGFPLSYAITAGTLPSGLSFAANGVISGTTSKLATTATANVTVQVGNLITNAVRAFAITVSAVPVPVWTTSAGSLGTVLGSKPFSNSVTATAPGYPVTYAVTTGTLPAGISLNAGNGALSGTATNPGATQNAVAFSITASDGFTTAAQAFSIQVVYDAAPIINTAAGSLATVTGGATVSVPIDAFDPTGYNQTLVYTISAGMLPAGITLNGSSGLIAGTAVNPGATNTANFTVQVSNGLTLATAAYSITVTRVAAPTWLTAANLGTVYQTQTISQSVVAVDNNSLPLSYAVTAGSLPSGLAMSSAGAITGIIANSAVTGLDTVTITAADSLSNTAQVFTLNVVAYTAPVWTTAAGVLVSGNSNAVVNTVVVATSVEGYAISYAVSAGTLPSTLTLSANGVTAGAIVGNLPVIGGTYGFSIAASDGLSAISQAFSVAVSATAPVWITASVPAATGLVAYSTTVAATNSPTFSITSGTLPAGLSLNASSGVISGTPANVGGTVAIVVGIGATSAGLTVNQNFTFVITQNLANFDPFAGAVILSLPLTGANGANSAAVFAEAFGHTVNVVGSPSVTTVATYNGLNQTPAVTFPNNAYLSIPLGSEAVFASNDYTIEWSAIGTLNTTILTFGNTAAGGTPVLQVSSTGILLAPFGSTTTANVLAYTAQSLTTAWFNYALVKHGSTLSLYVNGVIAGTATAATINSLGTPAFLVCGGQSNVTVSLKNLRVTNGAARYNGSYIVPAAFPLLPSFATPANTLLGVLTSNVPMPGVTIAAIDPWGLGLRFSADGLPAGLAIDPGTGLISGTPTGVYLDTTELAISVTVTDAYFNSQSRLFLLSVLAQPVADTQAGSTVLLLQFDGANGANAFTEVLGHTITPLAGVPVFSTTASLFGGSSLSLNGSSALSIPPVSNEFNLGNNDFTIEVSVNFTSVGAASFLSQRSSTTGFGWWFGMASSSLAQFNYSTTGADNLNISFAFTPVANTWYSLALVRRSNLAVFYVNGQQVGASAALPAIYPTLNNLTVGFDQPLGTYLTGYLDAIRLTNGFARYNASYTVAQAAFASPINWPQSPALQSIGQSIGLSGLNNTVVTFDLTPVEPYGASFSALSASGLPSGLSFANGIVSGTLATVSTDATSLVTVSATSPYSAASKSVLLTNYATPAGVDSFASNVTCFLSFNGIAGSNATNQLYNPAFRDLTGQSTVQTVGNPSINTTIVKNSGGALALNGSSALALTARTAASFSFGANDFTIECCVYLTTVAAASFVMSYASTTTAGFWLQYTSGTLMFGYTTGGTTATQTQSTQTWTPTVNTWYQLAVVRKANLLYMFVNGTQLGSAQAISVTLFGVSTCQIGYWQQAGTQFTTGYIDAVRITNGTGRYITTYTPAEYPPPPVWTTPAGSLTSILGGNII